jgi:hypothetical protein
MRLQRPGIPADEILAYTDGFALAAQRSSRIARFSQPAPDTHVCAGERSPLKGISSIGIGEGQRPAQHGQGESCVFVLRHHVRRFMQIPSQIHDCMPIVGVDPTFLSQRGAISEAVGTVAGGGGLAICDMRGSSLGTTEGGGPGARRRQLKRVGAILK